MYHLDDSDYPIDIRAVVKYFLHFINPRPSAHLLCFLQVQCISGQFPATGGKYPPSHHQRMSSSTAYIVH